MRRRGLSNVLVAGVILILATALFTGYMIYMDSSTYRVGELGSSVEEAIYRAGESIEAVQDGSLIEVRNVGDVRVEIDKLLVSNGTGFAFVDVELSLEPGETGYIPIPGGSNPVYLISTRGRVFPLGGDGGSGVGGDVINQFFYSYWIDNSTVIYNTGSQLNESIINNAERIENSLLVLGGDGGYAVIDLLERRTLYEGIMYLVPSRDGRIIYSENLKVYVDGRLLGTYNRLVYVGWNYMVLIGGAGYVLVTSDGLVQSLPQNVSSSIFLYNGNWTYYIWLRGWLGAYYVLGVLKIHPLNYSVERFDIYIPFETSLLASTAPYIYIIPMSIWILDDGVKPSKLQAIVYVDGLSHPLHYSVRLEERGAGRLYAVYDAIYREDPSQMTSGLIFDPGSSTLSQGYPLDVRSGSNVGDDLRRYFLPRIGKVSIHGAIDFRSLSLGTASASANISVEYGWGSVVLGVDVEADGGDIQAELWIGIVRGGLTVLDRYVLAGYTEFSLEIGGSGSVITLYLNDRVGNVYPTGLSSRLIALSIGNRTVGDTGTIDLQLDVKTLYISDSHLYPFRIAYTIFPGNSTRIWKVLPWFDKILKIKDPEVISTYIGVAGVTFTYSLRGHTPVYILDLDTGETLEVKSDVAKIGVYSVDNTLIHRPLGGLPYRDILVIPYATHYVEVSMHPRSLVIRILQY